MEAEREPSDRSVKEIVEALRPQLQELTQKQVELAKLELAPVAKKAGLASGLLSVGGVFLHLFLVFISVTGIYLLNEVAGLSVWTSALIVSGILLVIGLVLAGAGANILRKLDPKPHHSIRTFQQNIEWIKGQFKS
jgi:Na+-transporting NADH:ubiquinone oxidoreductase subunit NqrB